MKRFITVSITLFISIASIPAQGNNQSGTIKEPETSIDSPLRDSPFSLSLELSSRYIWRGLEYGDAPTTFAVMSYSHNGFGAYVEGVYAINGSHQEVDFGITYSYNWLFVGLSDYYYPSMPGKNDKYFNFANKSTGHWVELYTTLTPFKFPLWFTASSYIYGADKNPSGKQAFSSYAELGYNYNFKDDNVISLAVGASLNKSFYNNFETGFSVINIALKYSTAFKFGSFRLPVSASYVLNPQKEKSYFTFSIYFLL